MRTTSVAVCAMVVMSARETIGGRPRRSLLPWDGDVEARTAAFARRDDEFASQRADGFGDRPRHERPQLRLIAEVALGQVEPTDGTGDPPVEGESAAVVLHPEYQWLGRPADGH